MLIKILFQYILGYLRISIEGYYAERFINMCSSQKILIWNLKRDKDVKLYLNVGISDFRRLVKVAKKTKCKIKIVRKRGIPFLVNRYRKRKLFLILLAIVIISIYLSSKFVWNIEIQVEDNINMENIAEDIQTAGLKIGMKKDKVNTQEIVNKIRLERNDISWIGIDIKGTNAIVKIVKSKEKPDLIDKNDYCSIVADKKGVITKIIALNGTAKVKVGDEVDVGTVLISGTMEGKYTGIRYVHSIGEIEAIVPYTKTEKIYLKNEENVKTGKQENKYKIKINNFQINLYKTLSKFEIYDTIEAEKKFKIFSNMYLPISIIKITNEETVKTQKEYSVEEAIQIATQKLEEEFSKEITQNIIDKKVETNKAEEYIEVSITYEVLENIGMQEKVEITEELKTE